jgi:hypothetical protein
MRTIAAILFFACLACQPIAGRAAEPTPADIVVRDKEAVIKTSFAVFQNLFFSSAYNSLKCQENIYSLLVEIQKANLDLSQLAVVYVFNENHHKLVPTKSYQVVDYGVQRADITTYETRMVPVRPPPPNQFRYHVFAVVHGKVLDFDYTNSPVLEEVGDYFNRMFTREAMNRREKRKLFQSFKVRVIPSEDYIKDHPRHPSYYLFDLAEKYPARSVKSFLGAPGS